MAELRYPVARVMRVTYVIDSLGQGGAEKSLIAILGSLVPRGFGAEIVVLGGRDDLLEEAEATGTEVVRIAGSGGMLGAALKLSTHVRRTQPELIHTTLFRANVVGRVGGTFARIPVVSSLVNTPYGPSHFGAPGLRPARIRAAQMLDLTTGRLVRRFHANAEHVADTMASRLRIPRQQIDVVPRGRSRAELGARDPVRSHRVRSALGIGNRPLVLAVAREEHQKGLDTLIDAATRTRTEIVVAIAGRPGNASDALRRQARATGLEDRIHFLGFRGDVADLLAATDALALPSRREGFPGVILEAMALEAPVVASDLPGVREALGRDLGWLVPVDRADLFAVALDAVFDDPAGTRSRVSAARRRFDLHFGINAVADQMLEFYERALSG